MDEIQAAKEVLLAFLVSYSQAIGKLPRRTQKPLRDIEHNLLESLILARTHEALVDHHQRLHDLGGAIFRVRIISELTAGTVG